MAAFAIPAYTGFVDRAKQSEVLASGRVILVAAQTAAQETYAKNGTLADTNEAAILTLIGTYSGITGAGAEKYSVNISTLGVVTNIVFTDGTYRAVYDGANWTTSKDSTAVTTEVSIP
ncbi:hypothetical protein SDC9_139458 [bioreactor metagenome]|uniref:Uncharacterized protein n=1 Tax=bioreactor metagenome TaxID=1076179 RepID=A0A645DUR1_9ZZZZ